VVSTCDVEPFIYQATPQPESESGASSNQINEQALQDYLSRFKDAVCADLQALEAQVAALPTPAYGEIYVEDNVVPTVIPGANTWVQVTVFTNNGETFGAISDFTQSHVITTQTGIYLVLLSASALSGAGPGGIFEAEVRSNNGTVMHENVHWDRRLAGGGNDVGSTSMNGFIACSPGDTFELWVQNKTNGTDITIEDATLTALRVRTP